MRIKKAFRTFYWALPPRCAADPNTSLQRLRAHFERLRFACAWETWSKVAPHIFLQAGHVMIVHHGGVHLGAWVYF